LPKGSKKLENWLEKYNSLSTIEKNNIDNLITYLTSRGIGPDWYNFMYSPDMTFDINKRIIIPFYWKGDVVGYTGRLFEKIDKLKYYTDVQPGYVFNMDVQDWSRQFVIVTEGPFDAISVDGVALLGSEVKDQQALAINALNKKVILVPDRDDNGHKLMEQAIELGWSVSMPDWDEDVKDVNDAVIKYGRMYTLHTLVSSTEDTELKIKLRSKKWFG